MSKQKRFGQHFLTDHGVISSIMEYAAIGANDTIVEIGPGQGVLTEHLSKAAAKVFAIEVDRSLATHLQNRFKCNSNVELLFKDALTFDYKTIPSPFKVVSNLPYNVGTPITLRLIENIHLVSDMILMFQKEVAERMSARPGQKAYGSLSVFAQYHCDVTSLFDVDRKSFSPPPAVCSSVIRMTPMLKKRVSVKDEKQFFELVKASFAHKRKTLKNNLKAFGVPNPLLNSFFEEHSLTQNIRGEELSIETFADLLNFIKKDDL